MTPEPTPLVTVSQADREAAADFVRAWDELYGSGQNDCGPSEVDSVWLRSGDHDGELIVQALARHAANARLAALEAAEAKCEEVRQMIGADPGSSIASALSEARTAIRALSNKTGEGKTWCPTCGGPSPDGDDCLTCARWWRDNPPPADAASNKGGRDGE